MRNPFKKPAPSPFSADLFRNQVRRERKHFRRRWQWITAAVVVVVVGLAATGAYFYFHLQGTIQHQVGGLVPTNNEDTHPFNALLVGSDSRAGLSKKAQLKLGAANVGSLNADTLILAHIDPTAQTVIMMQFPRDLWVHLPGRGMGKINSSLSGGPGYVIKTIKSITGLDISHYIQVDLQGFRELVDAIGGVDVCVAQKVPFDTHTGFAVDKPGMIHFDGNEALRFVRDRHAFATGDFARIQNQQKFLAAAIHKATSVSSLLNPSHVFGVYRSVKDSVIVDQNTSLPKLKSILDKIRNIDPRHYQAYTVPNLGAVDIQYQGVTVSIVKPDWPAMRVMFEAISHNQKPSEADGTPDVAPSSIRLGVYNGTGESGAAAAAAARLERATTVGLGDQADVVETGNAPRFGLGHTIVRYSARHKDMGELVADAIPGAVTKQVPHTYSGTNVDVFVGKRFRTKQLVQLTPISLPPPGNPPPVCRHPGKLGHGP